MNSEIKYIADTLLMRQILLSDAAIRKDAQMFDQFKDAISWAKDAVGQHVLSHLDTSSFLSFVQSFGSSFILPAALFRLNPILGIIYTGVQASGVDLSDIWNQLTQAVQPKIENGERIDPGEIDGIIGGIGSFSKYEDHFGILRKLARDGELIKAAQPWGRNPTGGSFLFPGKNKSWFQRVFEGLAGGYKRKLGISIIAWLFKTALASAGLLLVGGLGKSFVQDMFGDKEKSQEITQEDLDSIQPQNTSYNPTLVQNNQPQVNQVSFSPIRRSHNFKPSGIGNEHHKNDSSMSWYVPVSGDIENTLKSWTEQVYPETSPLLDNLDQSPSFNKLVSLIEQNYSGGAHFEVPNNINSIKQLVDSFVGDLERYAQ